MPVVGLRTPLLVPIPRTFDEYLFSATKRARYEYKHAPKIDWREIEFDLPLVTHWMRVWERQIVKGKHPIFRKYTPEKCQALYEAGILRVFYCGIGLHMAEFCGDYVYCHSPLYEKKNAIAKAMWFALIRYCCGKVKWLDLGGGQQRRWNELVRDANYKWLYVPRNVETKPWRVQICSCGWRQLVDEPRPCSRCAS